MGYPKGLDEYDEDELRQELHRRQQAQIAGICDYCGRRPATSSCRFPERHRRTTGLGASLDELTKLSAELEHETEELNRIIRKLEDTIGAPATTTTPSIKLDKTWSIGLRFVDRWQFVAYSSKVTTPLLKAPRKIRVRAAAHLKELVRRLESPNE